MLKIFNILINIFMNCNDCHKEFKTKLGYQYHINNRVCLDKNKICSHCGKYFKDRRNYIYHTHNIVCEKEPIKPKITLKKSLEEEIDSLRAENYFLKGENTALKEHPQTQNNIDKQLNNYFIAVPPAFLKLDTLPILMYLFKKKVNQKL